MTTVPSRIVVGVDFSSASSAAVQYAAEEAVLRGAPLVLLHALDERGTPMTVLARTPAQLAKRADRELTALAAGLRDEWRSLDVSTELSRRAPVDALVSASAHAALVVVGSRGAGGFARLMLGSVAWRVAGRATGPVLLVRGAGARIDPARRAASDRPADRGSGPVLVAVNGTPDAQAALEFALEEAERRDVPLLVVNVWAFPDRAGLSEGRSWAGREPGWTQAMKEDAERVLSEAVAGIVELHPDVVVERIAAHGINITQTLLEIADARAAELVVVGARSRHPAAELALGAICVQLAQQAPQSVAVVRA